MLRGDVGKYRGRKYRNANLKVSSVVMKVANKTSVLSKIKKKGLVIDSHLAGAWKG